MRIEEIYQCFLECNGVATDTRNIHENSLFIALKGENYDANTFANESLSKGARYVILDNKAFYSDPNKMILVDDSLETLQELANYHRRQLGLPIIALTGSNGKTTSKELIYAVLSKKYNTKATVGNLNNHIGVPLTLLSFNEDTDIGIVEMGANHQKEIELLCDIAAPDFGYVTNFGRAHLEGFGGFEGVVLGKSEMYTYLQNKNKLAFVNLDDPIQVDKTNTLKRFTFSLLENKADVNFYNGNAQPMAEIYQDDLLFHSNLTGTYNIANIAIAVTIGYYFNVVKEDIKQAIETYLPSNNRSQWIQLKTNKILLDAYNANPSSMHVAIENFAQLKDANKVVFLGDMFELGDATHQEHQKIVDLVQKYNLDVFFVGEHFFENKNHQANFFKNFVDLEKYLITNKLDGKTILIKGSRGMALERLLKSI